MTLRNVCTVRWSKGIMVITTHDGDGRWWKIHRALWLNLVEVWRDRPGFMIFCHPPAFLCFRFLWHNLFKIRKAFTSTVYLSFIFLFLLFETSELVLLDKIKNGWDTATNGPYTFRFKNLKLWVGLKTVFYFALISVREKGFVTC